jgi:hypothetical protein
VGVPLDPHALRALAALLDRPEGAGADLAAAPALAWLLGVAGGPAVRVGLATGGPLGALARAAERSATVVVGAGEPGAEALAVARAHPEAVRLGGGVEGVRLLSVASADDFAPWREALAPGAAVALDGPGELPGASAVRLGPLTVAVPDGTGPVARALAEPAVVAPLGALLAAMGRGLAAAALPAGDGPALAEARRLAEDRLALLGAAQDRALAALTAASDAEARADREAARREAEMAAIARATAARERDLRLAHERIAALDAELDAARRSIAERFEEIAMLTQDRMADREG